MNLQHNGQLHLDDASSAAADAAADGDEGAEVSQYDDFRKCAVDAVTAVDAAVEAVVDDAAAVAAAGVGSAVVAVAAGSTGRRQVGD